MTEQEKVTQIRKKIDDLEKEYDSIQKDIEKEKQHLKELSFKSYLLDAEMEIKTWPEWKRTALGV